MKNIFDFIIIGSGPAGVSAAFPLLENGFRVLMVDGGYSSHLSSPSESNQFLRSTSDDLWKWTIGEDYYALGNAEDTSPKMSVPLYQNIFKDFSTHNKILSRNFQVTGSLASGGLSNAWGCGVACWDSLELSKFPFALDDLYLSYERVARRIGISGSVNDDLSEYFNLDKWSQLPIKMDPLNNLLYEKYKVKKNLINKFGFFLGKTRTAVISEKFNSRMPCNSCGNCLYGCSRQSMYSSLYDLNDLRKYNNFQYVSGFLVENLVKDSYSWKVEGINLKDKLKSTLTSEKLILAAGTLATTRLVLNFLKIKSKIPLYSCPSAAFLIWLPEKFGRGNSDEFGLGQLSYSLKLEDNIKAFGSTISTSGIPVSEFLNHMPFSKSNSIGAIKGFLGSCLIGNIFLSGESNSSVRVNDKGSLFVEGRLSNKTIDNIKESKKVLQRSLMHLGALILPFSFKINKPGSDVHYSGTLPMSFDPFIAQTDSQGELFGHKGLYIVDGSCLPYLSEKPHTLTIMANADRIANCLINEFKNKTSLNSRSANSSFLRKLS
jgi:choline dehydrogenase-like flavoprotein